MEEGKEERANESADDGVEIAFSDAVEEATEDDFFGDGGNDDGGDEDFCEGTVVAIDGERTKEFDERLGLAFVLEGVIGENVD